MKPDDHGNRPTPDEYRNWGSARTRVITVIVIALIFGGIITWLILTGHSFPGGGRY